MLRHERNPRKVAYIWQHRGLPVENRKKLSSIHRYHLHILALLSSYLLLRFRIPRPPWMQKDGEGWESKKG